MGQRMADLLTQLTAQNQAIVQSMQLQQQQLQQQFNAADIYGDDVGFIDDGYDRSKLNVPGLLHLEVAVRWAREHSSAPTTGSSGDGLPRNGEDDSGTSAPAAELPQPPAAAAPAAELPAPPAAAAPAAELPEPPAAAAPSG